MNPAIKLSKTKLHPILLYCRCLHMCNIIPCNWVCGCGIRINHSRAKHTTQVNIKTRMALCHNYVVQVYCTDLKSPVADIQCWSCAFTKHRVNYYTVDKILPHILINSSSMSLSPHFFRYMKYVWLHNMTEMSSSRSLEVRHDWLQQDCSFACFYACIQMLQHAARALLQHFILFYFTCADSFITSYSEQMAKGQSTKLK